MSCTSTSVSRACFASGPRWRPVPPRCVRRAPISSAGSLVLPAACALHVLPCRSCAPCSPDVVTEDGFSLEQGPERLDDGLDPLTVAALDDAESAPVRASFDESHPPALGPSFWPKVWMALLFVSILWAIYLGITMPPRERPAPNDPWTPSSGLCEGMTALECKWN